MFPVLQPDKLGNGSVPIGCFDPVCSEYSMAGDDGKTRQVYRLLKRNITEMEQLPRACLTIIRSMTAVAPVSDECLQEILVFNGVVDIF